MREVASTCCATSPDRICSTNCAPYRNEVSALFTCYLSSRKVCIENGYGTESKAYLRLPLYRALVIRVRSIGRGKQVPPLRYIFLSSLSPDLDLLFLAPFANFRGRHLATAFIHYGARRSGVQIVHYTFLFICIT